MRRRCWRISGLKVSHRQFLVLQDDIELVPEHPERVPTFAQAEVFTVTNAWLEPHRQWIQNWQQINPYIVANGRFVTPQMLDIVAQLFDIPMALFDAEHALQRRMEKQLARTAIFMLLHQGRLTSDDLSKQALSGATIFSAGTFSAKKACRETTDSTDLQDLSAWPSVDPNAMQGQRRTDLLNRIEAVRLYVAGTELFKIETATGVPRMQLYRLTRRCIEPDADGRIRGFRALIPLQDPRRTLEQPMYSPPVEHDHPAVRGDDRIVGTS